MKLVGLTWWKIVLKNFLYITFYINLELKHLKYIIYVLDFLNVPKMLSTDSFIFVLRFN